MILKNDISTYLWQKKKRLEESEPGFRQGTRCYWGVKDDESRKAAEFFLESESLRKSLQYTLFQVKSPHCLPQKIPERRQRGEKDPEGTKVRGRACDYERVFDLDRLIFLI